MTTINTKNIRQFLSFSCYEKLKQYCNSNKIAITDQFIRTLSIEWVRSSFIITSFVYSGSKCLYEQKEIVTEFDNLLTAFKYSVNYN